MIKFKQKNFVGLLDAGFVALGHVQNVKAEKEGQQQFEQNSEAFKQQLKENEEEHRLKMQELNQQLSQQKTFAAALLLPAIGSAIPLAGVSAVQGHKANKIAEEQGEEQMLQQARFQKEQAKQQERFQKEQLEMQEKIGKAQAKAMKQAGLASQSSIPAPVEMPSNGMFSEIEEEREYGVAATAGKYITKAANKLAESKAWKNIASKDIYKNARGFVSDVGKVAAEGDWGQKVANMAAMGTVMTGAGYIADKAIQADAKKSGIPIQTQQQSPEEQKSGSKLKKGLAIGAGTVGTAATALVLARKGKLNANTFKSVGNKLKTGFKEQFIKGPGTEKQIAEATKALEGKTGLKRTLGERRLKRLSDGKSHLATGNLIFTGGIAAGTVIGYAGQKKQIKSQINEEGQRQYAVPASILTKAGKGLKLAGGKIKNAGKGVVDWLSFGAGRSGQKQLGRSLYKTTGSYAESVAKSGKAPQMTGSGSKWTESVSKFLKNDTVLNKDGSINKAATFGKKAVKTAGGLAVGSSVMFLPFTVADKATRKVLGTVDKNAFAYEKSQNQQVPPQQ